MEIKVENDQVVRYKTKRFKENEIFTWSYKNSGCKYGNRCKRRDTKSS